MWLLKRFWDKSEEPELSIKVAAYAVEGIFWLSIGYVFGKIAFQFFS
jgi:hypothetical protein